MKSIERKLFFECHVGSKLYGTNRPDSDEDLMGVFLPSTKESFGLNPFSRDNAEYDLGQKLSDGARNTAGDTDRKFYRLDKFLSLLAEGQSKQLEMLFCPPSLYTITSPEWDLLVSHRELFVSKQAVVPFCRFAKAQSLKAVLKGENLNVLKEFVAMLEAKHPQKTMQVEALENLKQLEKDGKLSLMTMDDGVEGFMVAGRKYLMTQKTKEVKNKVQSLMKEYGQRSQNAADAGFDFKSLSHAYRLLFQAEQMLTEGSLTFPLKPEQVSFLKSVRSGEYKADYFKELEDKMDRVQKLSSTLPDKVNLERVDQLCQEMMSEHLLGEK